MATFIYDPAVRWPPPANILLNYDVVPPDPPTVQTRDAPNVLHTFSPIHDALRVAIVDRDASSPKEEKTPMPKVVIVGELYEQNVQVGGGPMPGGGGPVDPGYGRPDWGQGHPGNRPPGSGNYPSGGPIYGGGHPSGQPVPPGGPTDPGWGGGWGGGAVDPGWGQGGGEHPGNRPPYGGGHPSGQPIVPPPGGTDVPEDEFAPPPPPEDITSQYIVSVWDPKTMTWTTKSYPPR